MSARCLVTGVAGFLGSHVAERLVAKEHTVVGVDDLSGGSLVNIPAGVEFIRADVGEYSAMKSLFVAYRPRYVYHLAAYAAEGLSPHIRSFIYHNNVVASATLVSLSIAHDVERFVFTSSIAVYGKQTPPFAETLPKAPVDPYGLAKAMVEDDLALALDSFGLRFTIFRPHNVYGERQNVSDLYRNVVGIFMRQCLAGEPMSVVGDGSQVRAFSYVGDVAPIIADSVDYSETENRVFNIGGAEPHSVIALSRAVAAALDVPWRVCHLAARDEVHTATSCHRSIERVFGCRHGTPLGIGLANMASWVRSIRIGPPTALPCSIEVERGLPEHWQERR